MIILFQKIRIILFPNPINIINRNLIILMRTNKIKQLIIQLLKLHIKIIINQL